MNKAFLKKLSRITELSRRKADLVLDQQRVLHARQQVKRDRQEAVLYIKKINIKLLGCAKRGENYYEVCDANGSDRECLTTFQKHVLELLEKKGYPVYIKSEEYFDGGGYDSLCYTIVISW